MGMIIGQVYKELGKQNISREEWATMINLQRGKLTKQTFCLIIRKLQVILQEQVPRNDLQRSLTLWVQG